MKRFLILLVLVVRSGATIKGFCSLFSSNDTGLVQCEGCFTEMTDLQQSISNIKLPAKIFRFRHATVDVLPSTIFLNLSSVERLVFDRTWIKLLNLVEIGSHPFEYIKDKMERFEVYSSTGIYGWNWFTMPKMKNLRTLIIRDTKMISLSKQFDFAPDLRVLELSGAQIRFVHPYVFESHSNLTVCSLAGNEIETISRSMFSRPALKMWTLDLSFNKIINLPSDIFYDMPSLKEVQLDGNKLKEIDALRPVWDNLNEAWLLGNQLKCDSVCWVERRKSEPLFFDGTKCNKKNQSIYVDIACNDWLYQQN